MKKLPRLYDDYQAQRRIKPMTMETPLLTGSSINSDGYIRITQSRLTNGEKQ